MNTSAATETQQETGLQYACHVLYMAICACTAHACGFQVLHSSHPHGVIAEHLQAVHRHVPGSCHTLSLVKEAVCPGMAPRKTAGRATGERVKIAAQ